MLENAGDDPSWKARGPISQNRLTLHKTGVKDHHYTRLTRYLRAPAKILGKRHVLKVSRLESEIYHGL